MNWFSKYRLNALLSSMVVLCSCTTKVEISHSKTLKVEALSDNYQMIRTVEISSMDSKNGFYLVELKSKANMSEIIRHREMAFLYYELWPCEDANGSVELYSSAAYIDTQKVSTAAGGFYYYAPVPTNYVERIGAYQAMLGRKKRNLPNDICIKLGSGNMLGGTLTTNLTPIELK